MERSWSMTVLIRRGSARFVERAPGRETRHAFSFGSAYDPERLAFGPMVCHDEHVLRAGEGFEPHRHSGLDIITYVVDGALTHGDVVHDGEVTVRAGQLAHLVTGEGVEHTEVAAATPTRFVQMWLQSASTDQPTYTILEGSSLSVEAGRIDVHLLGDGDTLRLQP